MAFHLRPGVRFVERCVEQVQRLDPNDHSLYVWYFHRPLTAGRWAALVRVATRELLRFVIFMTAPFGIAWAAFPVAQFLCFTTLFILAPVNLLAWALAQVWPNVPRPIKGYVRAWPMLDAPRDALAAYVFLMAHDRGLWNRLFCAGDGTKDVLDWLAFFAQDIVSLLTGGASADMGLRLSSIAPVGWQGGLVNYGFIALVTVTAWQAAKNLYRRFRGGEFFTGSIAEAAVESEERRDVPGCLVSRVGVMQEGPWVTYSVPALANNMWALAHFFTSFKELLAGVKLAWNPRALATFGSTPVAAMGVQDVAVDTVDIGEDGPRQCLVIYHTKLVPTDSPRVTLDVDSAKLHIVFTDSQEVALPPLAVLRDLHPIELPSTVVFWQVSDAVKVRGIAVPLHATGRPATVQPAK